jgi:multisubunit Na+/H+ antiporter MnhB subunit
MSASLTIHQNQLNHGTGVTGVSVIAGDMGNVAVAVGIAVLVIAAIVWISF